jgi:hypothetical protein
MAAMTCVGLRGGAGYSYASETGSIAAALFFVLTKKIVRQYCQAAIRL